MSSHSSHASIVKPSVPAFTRAHHHIWNLRGHREDSMRPRFAHFLPTNRRARWACAGVGKSRGTAAGLMLILMMSTTLIDSSSALQGKTLLSSGSGTTLPFHNGSFNLVLCGHLVKHFDDIDVLGLFMEIKRVLEPGGLALIWEFGPTGNPRLDAWNARFVSNSVKEPRLRSQTTLKRLAADAGFEFIRDADLRPFLLPPIPRSSVLIGIPPEE